MRYQPPYGRESEGDAAHYINGNPVEGRLGSIPPAAAFEYPMRELLGIIEKSKLTASDSDLLQVSKGVRSQRMNYAEDTGSVNNLSVAFDPPLGSYTVGLIIRVKVYQTTTGPATIDAGAGRVGVIRMNGGSTQAGDMPGGGVAEMVFDGTRFQLVNFLGGGGPGGDVINNLINIPYAVDQSPTPNIVDATFTTLPADYTLKAGDPFLVRINNTCTGASIARFKTTTGGLGDKPIRANGGGGNPLLQGDVQVGDVVLFIYDGTQFWIQPNPFITANCQFNIPSQYATVEDACAAIRRKTIVHTAMVTFLIAKGAGPLTSPAPYNIPGCYAPFKVNHANADRITIRGEMKIPGNLTGPMFSQTGNFGNDSANNIAMLRSRFGVEILVPSAGGTTTVYGIENIGPQMPTLQDILVTGPNFFSGNGITGFTGISSNFNAINVSVWGVDTAFYGGGRFNASYCFAVGGYRAGALATAGAQYSFYASGCFGNYSGFHCTQNSFLGCSNSWSNFNQNAGAAVGDMSELTWHTCQAVGNAYADLFCSNMSELFALNTAGGGGFGTVSPTPGVLSYNGAYVVIAG
jgi:hypothetical protein